MYVDAFSNSRLGTKTDACNIHVGDRLHVQPQYGCEQRGVGCAGDDVMHAFQIPFFILIKGLESTNTCAENGVLHVIIDE